MKVGQTCTLGNMNDGYAHKKDLREYQYSNIKVAQIFQKQPTKELHFILKRRTNTRKAKNAH